MLNHLSSVYLTDLDVLDDLDEIKFVKKYKIGDQEVEGIHPTLINDFEKLTPIFKTMKGWKEDITGIEDFDKLPENCKSFIKEIEKASKVQTTYISVNSDEDEGLLRIIR